MFLKQIFIIFTIFKFQNAFPDARRKLTQISDENTLPHELISSTVVFRKTKRKVELQCSITNVNFNSIFPPHAKVYDD